MHTHMFCITQGGKYVFHRIQHVELDICGACNLSCPYCYLQSGAKDVINASHYMTADVFDKFLDAHSLTGHNQTGLKSISFWGGEPLLNFPLIEHAVRRINQKRKTNRQPHFLVVTNGTLIDKNIAEFCAEHGVRIQISLDGDQEYHDVLRCDKSGCGTFDRIIQNIHLLQDAGAQYQVITTLTAKSPVPSLIMSALEQRAVCAPHFGVVNPITEYDHQQLSPINGDSVAADIFRAYTNVVGANTFCNSEKPGRIQDKFPNIDLCIVRLFSDTARTSCGLSNRRIAVKYDGGIYPCRRMVDSPKYQIGTVWEGFYGVAHESLCPNCLETNVHCKKCPYRYLCGGMCGFEMLQRNDFNYVQRDVCAFLRGLFRRTLAFLAKLYFSDRASYLHLVSDHLGSTVHLESTTPNLAQEMTEPITLNSIPFRASTAQRIDLKTYGLLYSLEDFSRKCFLNVAAMAIWDIVDGRMTLGEIATKIAEAQGQKVASLQRDVVLLANEMYASGFLDFLCINRGECTSPMDAVSHAEEVRK